MAYIFLYSLFDKANANKNNICTCKIIGKLDKQKPYTNK